ncbi:MAG: Gfo/Idh/MocA family oxidoreductase [Bryobacteraceae bacterium]|nr:Gfo/Idh/MocA family oxidoreductase [Bryobacterales bacterium]MEB2359963.1 Gfo/Idh/MocA family oxidoreductase [Bryobacterales bacterium]NUN00396.1 Gfo/Idh/MocA family oxidoreductase [Bryobacteraceae bacterium]
MNRRYFLLGAAVAPPLARASTLASPNDTVRVACVGFHGQGRAHLRAYPKLQNVEIAAVCDIDQSVLEKGAKQVEDATKKRPTTFTDLRKLLEDKSIDAISIATPNHLHALQTIWGCQAGKDVYVEKPCTHNIFEARQIVAAARKYNRMVQHGTGARSSSSVREAAQKLREGVIGDLYMARGLCFKWRDTIGRAPVEPVPAGVDYDLWLGPAPKREFTRNRFHYNFHWFWDYGNGDFGNQGAHQIDVARWLLGVKYPTRVSAMGGHFMFDDDQETPNTMVATFEFNHMSKKKMLVFEVRHWISNHEAGIGEPRPGVTDPASPNTIGDIIYGSKGYLVIGGGYKTFLGKEQEPGPASSGRGGGDNFANFIGAVRSRKTSDLNAEIEEGATSTVLIHLANISYRLGRTLEFDPTIMACRNDAEANRMMSRQYRAPFVVPKQV